MNKCLAILTLCVGLAVDSAYGQDRTAQEWETARTRLEAWRTVVRNQEAIWFRQNQRLAVRYENAWSDIDLEQSLEMHDQGEVYASEIGLVEKLAMANRWSDLERVCNRLQKGHYHLLQFLARLAERGYEQRDMSVIELAGKLVEQNVTEKASFPGAPPILNRDALSARFFVAASRLELMRANAEKYRSNEIYKAGIDLIVAARGVPTQIGGFFGGPAPLASPLEHFAALECWTGELDASPEKSGSHGFFPLKPNQDERLRPLVDRLKNSRVSWYVELPTLDSQAVAPWIQRQAHVGRQLAALAYLVLANGSDSDRARLLAVLARATADSSPEDANLCLQVAESFCTKETVFRTWDGVEAGAAVCMAKKALAGDESAQRWSDRVVNSFHALIRTNMREVPGDVPRASEHYKRMQVDTAAYEIAATVAEVLSASKRKRGDLDPYVLVVIDALGNYDYETKTLSSKISGIRRRFDFSQLFSPDKRPPSAFDGDLPRLLGRQQYLQATEYVEQKSEGNLAWRTHYADIGKASFRKVGLAGTFKWTSQIEDDQTRLDVELGAIQELTAPTSKSLSRYRSPFRVESIAPGIRWPSWGC